jgi:hypothetical protein
MWILPLIPMEIIMAKKSKFSNRRKDEPMGDRKITVHHEAVDGAKGFSKFSELKWARREAQKWVGEHPEIGSTYAVSGDGVMKVTVSGATLAELFPTQGENVVTFTPAREIGGNDNEAGAVRPDGSLDDKNKAPAPEQDVGRNEADAERPEPKSVVASKFKQRYLAHARELGVKGKAARRSNWDWLAQQIALQCLDNKHKINLDKFCTILDANGVDHSKWTNRSTGWEGRLRMTGRVALQRIVADANVLKMPDGVTMVPPEDFVEKYKTKA